MVSTAPVPDWRTWCAHNGVDPVLVTAADLADFVLDLINAGTDPHALTAALERAGDETGPWRTSGFATLRLGLSL